VGCPDLLRVHLTIWYKTGDRRQFLVLMMILTDCPSVHTSVHPQSLTGHFQLLSLIAVTIYFITSLHHPLCQSSEHISTLTLLLLTVLHTPSTRLNTYLTYPHCPSYTFYTSQHLPYLSSLSFIHLLHVSTPTLPLLTLLHTPSERLNTYLTSPHCPSYTFYTSQHLPYLSSLSFIHLLF